MKEKLLIYPNQGFGYLNFIASLLILAILIAISLKYQNVFLNLLLVSQKEYSKIYINKKLRFELEKIVRDSDFSTLQIYPKIVSAKELGFISQNNAIYFYNLFEKASLTCKEKCLIITEKDIIESSAIDQQAIGFLPYDGIYGIFLDEKNSLRFFQIKENKIIENQPLGITLDSLDFKIVFLEDKTFSLITTYVNNGTHSISVNSRVIRQLPFNQLFNHE